MQFCTSSTEFQHNWADPIADQFSMITRPSPRANGLKTVPFPAAHTRIANIWEYPLPPGLMGVQNLKKTQSLVTHGTPKRSFRVFITH